MRKRRQKLNKIFQFYFANYIDSGHNFNQQTSIINFSIVIQNFSIKFSKNFEVRTCACGHIFFEQNIFLLFLITNNSINSQGGYEVPQCIKLWIICPNFFEIFTIWLKSTITKPIQVILISIFKLEVFLHLFKFCLLV